MLSLFLTETEVSALKWPFEWEVFTQGQLKNSIGVACIVKLTIAVCFQQIPKHLKTHTTVKSQLYFIHVLRL